MLVFIAWIAHEFHDLPGKLLARVRAVAHAEPIHHVAQAHDAQTDAARAVRGFGKFRHGRDVLVRVHDIVEKMRREFDGLAQFRPVHFVVRW